MLGLNIELKIVEKYSSHEPSDEEIVQGIQNTRDTSLFEVLYERHSTKVYNKCLGFAKNSQAAEDLTHDIFLKAYLGIKTFQGKAKFSTWLYSLTYNYCVDYFHSQRKDQEELKEYLQDEALVQHDSEPSDEVLMELRLERLQIILDQISPDDRVILLMKYQDDFSLQEMAESLGLGLSTVKMRIKRAKIRVVEIYDQNYSRPIGQKIHSK